MCLSHVTATPAGLNDKCEVWYKVVRKAGKAKNTFYSRYQNDRIVLGRLKRNKNPQGWHLSAGDGSHYLEGFHFWTKSKCLSSISGWSKSLRVVECLVWGITARGKDQGASAVVAQNYRPMRVVTEQRGRPRKKK